MMLSIHLGIVLRNDVRVSAAQPLSAYREAAVMSSFGNVRLLQEMQRATTCTNEDKWRTHYVLLVFMQIFQAQLPVPSLPRSISRTS